ncbi:uncharacterized protein BO87DRAFT_39738 [Aspergillus neoniger CBS 115656]|uniref:Uncharacterized protein n=1 Tax=Aspergillus neoniger (strain CBS 115656) TaxID=1448310 RepID=A0A318YRJ2_ASPNB|nr:hypothetical protein BO87DRAFT_39738 [Aspergillus neoniger CBS 115656]PYH34670.1 hypothetical protein BO87DRAFT_39738 [Aspergillus neoniger CBS 115656]
MNHHSPLPRRQIVFFFAYHTHSNSVPTMLTHYTSYRGTRKFKQECIARPGRDRTFPSTRPDLQAK